jgi:hypothetical protein
VNPKAAAPKGVGTAAADVLRALPSLGGELLQARRA